MSPATSASRGHPHRKHDGTRGTPNVIHRWCSPTAHRHLGRVARESPTGWSLGARTVLVIAREQELVQLFGSRTTELDALQGLMGGITMTHLRTVCPRESTFEALVQGLRDPNPRVRWWCVQVLDHSPEPRAIAAIAPMLDDPVPRVRQNAAHALGCGACKPAWSGELPTSTLSKLDQLASGDTHAKVRRQAGWALACWQATRHGE